MKSKRQIDDRDEGERAVSPVIGVILMVAITVILAAVIAAFVLDLGSSTSSSPQAGFTVNDESASTGYTEYTVQISSIERLDSMTVSCDDTDTTDASYPGSATDEVTLNSVGDDGTVTCEDDDDITIIGTYDGNEAVMN
ncbi:type IV pilin N-terminal domain-containing protein [Halobacteria archaeon AArc-curdl1]|uniref:Type IV pilin N-terminal domain-containing protein n=1 Tax=Natronosalvus hydrolyticus TaxID=2979988 RepID=A0AAP2Z6E9_9EURY|nr:type IV pilin N-terminal domain-containing protein [Halobacteria archaeon AArc-curdl1]